MSDLINRSALIEFVKEELKQDRPYDFKIKNIQRFIEDMPTAYNVDAVVAELEEWTYKADVIMPRGDIVKNVKLISSGSAIDIVRKGGVE